MSSNNLSTDNILLYQIKDGQTKIGVTLANNTEWLTAN